MKTLIKNETKLLIIVCITISSLFLTNCLRRSTRDSYLSEEFYPWVSNEDDSLLFAYFPDETIEEIYGLWLENNKIPEFYKYGCKPNKGIRSIKKQVTAGISLVGIVDSSTVSLHPYGDSLSLRGFNEGNFAVFEFHFASRSSKTFWKFVSAGEFAQSYSVVVIFWEDELFQTGKHSWEEVEIYFRSKGILIDREFGNYVITSFERGVLVK